MNNDFGAPLQGSKNFASATTEHASSSREDAAWGAFTTNGYADNGLGIVSAVSVVVWTRNQKTPSLARATRIK